MSKYLVYLVVGLTGGLMVPGVVRAQGDGIEIEDAVSEGGIRAATERLDFDSRDWVRDLILSQRGPQKPRPCGAMGVRGSTDRLQFDSRSAFMVPEELRDPAFERYVDLGLLARAWNEKDAALLTDVALQLAEGERILLRAHKAISADKLFEIAVRAATAKKDKATLDRLTKVIGKGTNDKLKARLSSATKLAGESRGVDPMAMVSIHEMTPETFVTYQNLVKQVQAARIGGSRDLLKDLEQATNDAVELSDKQREYLLKIMSSARAEIPEDAKPDPGIEALEKLSHSARARTRHAHRNPEQTAKIAAGILQIIAAALDDNAGGGGGGGGVVVHDDGEVILGEDGGTPTSPDGEDWEDWEDEEDN